MTVRHSLRGPALAAAEAVQRADFNGDTVDDYLLDTGKLRRTRQERFLTPAKLLMIYTSTMASGHIHSLDVSPTSYRIVPGAKATLFVHQSYSSADETVVEGEGEEVPWVNETLAMRDERRWGIIPLRQVRVCATQWHGQDQSSHHPPISGPLPD